MGVGCTRSDGTEIGEIFKLLSAEKRGTNIMSTLSYAGGRLTNHAGTCTTADISMMTAHSMATQHEKAIGGSGGGTDSADQELSQSILQPSATRP